MKSIFYLIRLSVCLYACIAVLEVIILVHSSCSVPRGPRSIRYSRDDSLTAGWPYAWWRPLQLWSATRAPFHWHGLTLISTWINDHITYKVWDEITYQFPNFSNATEGVYVFKSKNSVSPSNFDSNDPIRSQFCTYHDSSAVMACAKLWLDWIIMFHARTTCIFARFGLWPHKHYISPLCLCHEIVSYWNIP